MPPKKKRKDVDDATTKPPSSKRQKRSSSSKPKKMSDSDEEDEKKPKSRKGVKGGKGARKDDPEGHAASLVRKCSVSLTGIPALPAESKTLEMYGVHSVTQGSVLELDVCESKPKSGVLVPPRTRDLEAVAAYPALWQQFMQKLKLIPAFVALDLKTDEDQKDWLFKHAQDVELCLAESLAERSITTTTIIAAGESKLVGLPPEVLDEWYVKQNGRVALATIKASLGSLSASGKAVEYSNEDSTKTNKKTSLFFLFAFWSLVPGKEHRQRFAKELRYEGLYIRLDVGGGGIKRGVLENEHILRVTMCEQPLAIVLSDKKDPAQPVTVACQKTFETVKHLSPGVLKSAMQKIIRGQALEVPLPDGVDVKSDPALQTVMHTLFHHPGSFVPDIRRFVTGLESLKRLGVIALEDSYTDNPNMIVQLFAASLVKQKIPRWKPTPGLMSSWLDFGIKLLNTSQCFDYEPIDEKDPENNAPKHLDPDRPWHNVAHFLAELKSFAGDIRMAKQIAADGGKRIRKLGNARPLKMKLTLALDQHCTPNVAYFLPSIGTETPSEHAKLAGPAAAPFVKLWKKWFSKVSGLNPRREDVRAAMQSSFVTAVSIAQDRYWESTLKPKSSDDKEDKANSFDTFLKPFHCMVPEYWLAAGLGTMKPKMSPAVLVSMSTEPGNLGTFKFILQPARQMKSFEVEQKYKDKAEKLCREMLKKGIRWRGCTPPNPEWRGKLVRWKESTNEFTLDGVPWEKARCIKTMVAMTRNPDISIFVDLLPNFGDFESELRRLLFYIGHYQSVVKLPSISKSGGGTKQMVMFEDIHTFKYLMNICRWWPSALIHVSGVHFKSPFPPLLWKIADCVRCTLNNPPNKEWFMGDESKTVSTNIAWVSDTTMRWAASLAVLLGPETLNIPDIWRIIAGYYVNGNSSPWGLIEQKVPRRRHVHQISAIEELMERRSLDFRSHYIWIPAGSGKTDIQIGFWQRLQQEGKLPDYIVICTTASAFQSTIDECNLYTGLSVRVLDVTRVKRPDSIELLRIKNPKKEMPKHSVIIVEHDMVRSCMDILMPIMPRSVFLLDEVHKAYNDTQRSNCLLQLLAAAAEAPMMTGTAVIDSNVTKLATFLEFVVPFEVTPGNFFMAVNSVISKTDIVEFKFDIQNHRLVAKLTADEQKQFQELMPPALGGLNDNATSRTKTAGEAICNVAADREIVKFIGDFDVKLNGGVFVAAETAAHAKRLTTALVSKGMPNNRILMLSRDVSINLTPDNLKTVHPDVHVVITTKGHSTGYNLSRFHTMVYRPYKCNEGNMIQLRARLTRYRQRSKVIDYYVAVDETGFLDRREGRHIFAQNVSSTLKHHLSTGAVTIDE